MFDPPPLFTRPVEIGDARAITAIYAKHVKTGTASFDMVARTQPETEAKISECQKRGWPFLVATLDDVVVGYAYVTQFRDRAAYAATCENSIYIMRKHHGLGIGTALLSRLIAEAEDAGFRQMIAVVGGGEPASVALHLRLGFVHAGTMHGVGRKFGRWLDTVYLQRALGDASATPPIREPGA